MKRSIITISFLLLPLAACDLGTAPEAITLNRLSTPPRNHATIALTETLTDAVGRETMTAGTQYFFPLRTPPPLPELVFDDIIAGGSPMVRMVLLDETQTGEFSTSEGVVLQFGAPDGAVFTPRSSCRVTVLSALNASGDGRLQGEFDCPMQSNSGAPDMRVLVKFDHSP